MGTAGYRPGQGSGWLRQGDPDVLGISPSDAPMAFARWNGVLNQLGRQGWNVASTELIEGEATHEQLWLLEREFDLYR